MSETGKIPFGLDKTLVAAADQINVRRGELTSIFPEPEVTGQAVSLSHLITEADIVRLRNASAHKLSPWVEASWAAVVAAIPPFLVVVIGALQSKSAYTMTVSDFVSCCGFIAALPIAVVLTLLNKRGTSVDDICDKIEGRPRYVSKGDSL